MKDIMQFLRKALFFFKLSRKKARVRSLLAIPGAYIILKKKPARVDMPILLLGMELTTRCPLECKICFRKHLRKERIGDMDFYSFRKALSQFDDAVKLCLSGLGENMLHPDIFRMISYAKKIRNIPFVWMASNGQVMDREKAHELVSSGLDWLLVSADSPDRDTYGSIRKNGSLDLLRENLGILMSEKKKNRTAPLRITLDTTIQKDNIDQLEGMVRMAAELEPDGLLFANVVPDFAGDLAREVSGYDLSKDRIKRISLLAKDLKVKLIWAEENRCFEPWLRPCITWDGYLIPCYIRPVAEDFNFGNIFERPFYELWNSPAMLGFRASDKKPQLCSGCIRTWK